MPTDDPTEGPSGSPDVDPTVQLDGLASPGRSIGPYLLRERIGSGGMGEVWKAEQTSPVRRTVALKLIKAGMDSREVLARFEAERQALALMDHPFIAKVFDAGTTPEGRPYFAMEYVKGTPITAYCDKRRLSTHDRLTLFQRVCDGVQHAHQKAVLHRDLKPGNILVADVDGRPLPKIIDFGVAKATTQKLTEKTVYTALGQLIGTPEYMSPEQAELTGEDVDTRTDVYSLGVVLYELLVGALPFEAKELRKAGLEGIVRILREHDPPRPSTKLSTLGERTTQVAQSRATGPKRLSSLLRGDLDWITMRCLEKDRNRRYGSPMELAQDIRRHLEHEPVLAGPPSAGYRAKKFVRRNRIAVAAAAAALIVLVAFSATTAVQSHRIAAERDRANREAKASARVSNFMAQMLGDIDPHRFGNTLIEDLHDRVSEELRDGFDTSVYGVNRVDLAGHLLRSEILNRATSTIENDLADQPLIAATLYQTLGNTYADMGLHEDAIEQLRRAVEIRTQEFGADHRLTLQARHDHAVVHSSLITPSADLDQEAMVLLRGVVKARRNLLGPEHPETLESLYRLGVFHHQSGQMAVADSVHREAYDARLRVLGPDHPNTLVSMHAVADMGGHRNRWDEADSLFTIALEKLVRVYGPEHQETLACKLDMAFFCANNQFQHEVGVRLLKEVLDVRQRLLGHNHPDTMWTAQVVAEVSRAWSRLEEYARIQEELLELKQGILGPDDPQTHRAKFFVAHAYSRTGRFDEADALYDEAIAGLNRTAPNGAVSTIGYRQSRAAVYRSVGRLEPAARILEECLREQREVLDMKKPPIELLANVYKDMERYEEAERLCLERIVLLESESSPDHDSLLHWKQELGKLYQLSDRHEDAEPLLRCVVEERPEDDKDTLSSLAQLGRSLEALGRAEQAAKLYDDYVEIRLEAAAKSGTNVRIKAEAVRALLEDVPAEHLDFERVIPYAERMNELTNYRNPRLLNALALAYHRAGRSARAVEIQRMTLGFLHPHDPVRQKEEAMLEEFELALAQGRG